MPEGLLDEVHVQLLVETVVHQLEDDGLAVMTTVSPPEGGHPSATTL